MATQIRNLSGRPMPLPFPYGGVIPVGGKAIVNDTFANVLAKLGGLEAVRTFFDLKTTTDTPDHAYGPLTGPYTLSTGVQGRPDGAAVLFRFPVVDNFSFAVDMANSRGVLGVAPNASAIFSLQKNAVQFGTLTFLAGQTVGTFLAALATSFVAGVDILTVVAPNPQDLLLGDLGLTLAGTRTLT